MPDLFPGFPGFTLAPKQVAFGTVLTGLVPPMPAGDNRQGGQVYALNNNGYPAWWTYGWYTHITSLLYTTSTTAHHIIIARPKNWTTFSAAVAKNSTSISLTDDPGVYSTNWRYQIPGQSVSNFGVANPQTGPSLIADAAISATNNYVCYQLADGLWQLDTIASGTFGGANLVLTTGTPNRTLGTIAKGAPLFYFGAMTVASGVAALSNPQTGQPDLLFTTTASTNKQQQLGDYQAGGITVLNPGDPIMLISDNITATGIMDLVAGDYRKF